MNIEEKLLKRISKKKQSAKDWQEFIKLAESEIKEWEKFKKYCENKLYDKNTNKNTF